MNKRNLLILAFALCFFIGNINAQNTEKKYQSLLWKITSPENPGKTSYLYGTMHVSSRLAFNLSDSFFIGLNSVDMIALESNPTDWLDEVMNLKYATEYFGYYPSYNYADRGFYQTIFPLDPPQNSDIAGYIASRDIMSNSILFRNDPYMTDFEEDTYLDMFIYMAGAKTGRPVVGLENINETNDLGRIARTERVSRKDEKPTPLWLEERMKKESINEIFEDTYRKQDLDLMMELQGLYSSDHYLKYFLNERNRLMADSLFILMKTKTVFTGIGAAHLGGDEGVIEFLRQKGCTVTPVTFERNDFAKQQKEQYDSLRTDLKFSKQISPDNQFSINLPDKLYELPYSGKHFLCSEMTNGSFFSVNKINTYSLMDGISPETYLDKVDSLLFENVPGKIQSKKRIQNGPYKGIEVKNKTKTGNSQHYQIFATPFEIIIMKMGGTKDFIEKWSDSVFSTLNFNDDYDKKLDWSRHDYVYGGFSVELPPVNLQDCNTPISAAYNNPVFHGEDPKTGGIFLLTRNILFDFYYIEEDKFELERTVERLAKKHNMEVGTKKLFEFNKLPALDFTLIPEKKKKGQTIYFRMVLSGGYYYLMGARTKSQKQADRFFESFRIESFVNQKPFEEFKDTILHFSVTTAKDINESGIRMSRYREKPKDYEEYIESYIYQSETGESVRVYFEKFAEYNHYPDADSIFNINVKEMSDDKSMYIFSENRFEKDGMQMMDLYVADTGSIKLVKIRNIIKKGGDAQYVLRSLVDSVNMNSPFINTFFETFTPVDSTIGMSVFDDKGSLFLNDLLSGDTARYHKAIKSFNEIKFSKNDVDTVILVINTYPFAEKKQEYIREFLLSKLSEVKSESLIPFAEKLYLESVNNYPIQLRSLEIIAAQKNKESIESFKRIMKQDLPFIMSNDWYVLSPLRFDSSELWKNMYPDLYEYAHLQDYKNIIFSDLTRMLDSNKIDGGFYQAFLPKLIEQAELDLKKSLAAEQKEKLKKEKSDALDETSSSTTKYYYDNNDWMLIQKYKLMLPHIDNSEIAELLKNYDENIDNEDNQISMINARLRQKKDVDEKIISKILEKPKYTISVYSVLEKNKRLDLMPKEFMDDKTLALHTIQGTGYSYNSFDLEKDTFKMLSTTEAEAKEKKYKIYYYEVNQYISTSASESFDFDAKDYNKLLIIAVEMKDGKVYPVGDTFNKSVTIENPERREKYIEELEEGFKVRGRERASAQDVSDMYWGYW